jgi:prepilin-type N-terminal cleavage/methylation domain-containing protein
MAERRPIHRAARRAFTLIELTTVILIMAIMTAVAAPRYYAALANYRVNAAAGRIAADLRMVRQYARKASANQTVTFNAATDSYSAPNMPDMNNPNATYAVALNTADYRADISSAIFGALPSMTFDMYGRPSASGTVVVRSGGLERTVQVDDAGNVSIL